jgi:hypothetical protein
MKAMHRACMSRLQGLKEAGVENAKLRNDQLQLLRRLEDGRDVQKDYDDGLERLRKENEQLRRQQDVLRTKNDMLEGQVNQLVGMVNCSPSWRMASHNTANSERLRKETHTGRTGFREPPLVLSRQPQRDVHQRSAADLARARKFT